MCRSHKLSHIGYFPLVALCGTGQHLVTAKAIELFGYETESWNLGDTISFLDLATAELTSDELSTLESSVNDAITTGHDVTPRWIEPTDPEMEKIRCRGAVFTSILNFSMLSLEAAQPNQHWKGIKGCPEWVISWVYLSIMVLQTSSLKWWGFIFRRCDTTNSSHRIR
eukprot:m.196564 g.196564  ORF g.196564 m.196564 type:complete len:168 (+) comp18693_c0_seq9:807-1310(+)